MVTRQSFTCFAELILKDHQLVTYIHDSCFIVGLILKVLKFWSYQLSHNDESVSSDECKLDKTT